MAVQACTAQEAESGVAVQAYTPAQEAETGGVFKDSLE